MPGVYIRELPGHVYRRLEARAKRNRRSITQEAAMILEDALGPPRPTTRAWDAMDVIRERLRARYGGFDDSTRLVREDRDR